MKNGNKSTTVINSFRDEKIALRATKDAKRLKVARGTILRTACENGYDGAIRKLTKEKMEEAKGMLKTLGGRILSVSRHFGSQHFYSAHNE